MEDNNNPVYRRKMAQLQNEVPPMREFTVGSSSSFNNEEFETPALELNERVKQTHKQKSEHFERISPMVTLS